MFQVQKIYLFVFLVIILSVSGCLGKKQLDVKFKDPSAFQTTTGNLNISTVAVVSNQLIIRGSGLGDITSVKLSEGGVDQTLTVESAASGEIVAKGVSTVNIGVGKIFDMILSDANGSVTFPVSFSLDNASVTAAMLAPMGATPGQVLKYTLTGWAPVSQTETQAYIGTWDATTTIPDITATVAGDYYVVSVAGGTYAVGDWIISDGYAWSKLAYSKTSVSSFQNRKGIVTLVPADYVSLKATTTPFKIPGSSINDFLDVDLSTAPLDGQVLKYTTAGGLNKWVAGTAGSASNIGLSDLSATAPLTYNNTTGVFSLVTADLLATQLTNLASGSGAVTATDTLLGAFGKLMAVPSDYVSKSSGATMTTGTIALSGTAMITVPTATGVTATEVTNVTYVTNAIAANGAWSKGSGGSAGTINFSTGNVGIGTATPTAQMHIANAATEGTVYLNRPPSGATIFNEIVGPTGTVTAGGTVLAVRSSTSMGGGGSVFTAYASGGAGLRVAETGAIYMSNNVSMSGGPATIGIGGIGNTNTFSSGNSAAHTNTDFLFRAGAADRTAGNLFQISNYTAPVLTVLATSGSGNVGIGTTSTSQKLEINGNVGVPYNVGGAGQSGYSILSSAGGSAINRFGQNSATTIISNFESNGFSFNNTGGTLFRVDNTGKVGIGTTSPASLLDVQGTFDQQAVVGVSGQAGRINFRRGTDGALAGAIGYSSATDGGGMLLQSGGGAGAITLNAAGGAITFNSSNTYTATMLNGNLGVGTTNPTYSLSVSRNGGTAGQTAFFQDATPTTGATKLVVRAGAGQGTNSLQEWQNSAGTPEIRIGPYNGTNTIIESTNGFLTSYGSQTGLFSGSLRYPNSGTGVKFQFGTNGGATLTSGSMTEVGFGGNPFVPTSGTGVMNQLAITSTINQTGGANGTTRGIYIIPTLTSAADYRSIEIVPNQGYGIYQSGSSALNYFNGNVGIGTPSPSTLIHVNTATVGATVATFQSGTGSCTVVPNAGMSCSSDSRLKENVETIFNGLDKVLKLRGVTFQWKDRDTKDNSKHIGFIAQEVAKVAPELVKEDTRGYKQVNYANFVAVLTEAIKDLYHNHVVKIYDHLFTTEERVAQLEAENFAMKNYLCAKDMSAVFCKSFPPSLKGEK